MQCEAGEDFPHRLASSGFDEQAAQFIDLPCKVYCLCLQDLDRMAAMAFIFEFYDPVVEGVQLVLQVLDFVLNREARSRNSINLFSGLCSHRKQVAVSRPPCGHGFSAANKRGPPFAAMPPSLGRSA